MKMPRYICYRVVMLRDKLRLESVDGDNVEEVVHCADCVCWEPVMDGKGFCKDISGFGRWWRDNDYCSYGKRRDAGSETMPEMPR